MNPQTTVTGLGIGKNILEWTIIMCDSTSRSRVTIERVVIPPAPIAVSPAAVCPGTVLPLLSALGNQLCWYADKKLQHLLHQGSAYQPKVDSTTTFYVTQRVHGYESNPTAIDLVIKPQPEAPLILPTLYYCAGEIIQPFNGQWKQHTLV
jgi:hypothetical protein